MKIEIVLSLKKGRIYWKGIYWKVYSMVNVNAAKYIHSTVGAGRKNP